MKTWNTKNGYTISLILSGRSNVFLLINGQTNILIDTSVSWAWGKIQKKLSLLNIQKIDYLIVTHAHFDHAANARKIKENYKASVIVQKEEVSSLANGDTVLPEGTMLFSKAIINILGQRLLSRFRYEPCQPDIVVESRYDLATFGFNAYLMHTPGHTAGSTSLIVDEEIAIVGDAMFGVVNWSVVPPFADDKALLLKSWGELLKTNCSLFLPSHGRANSRLLVEKEYDKWIKKGVV